MHNVKKEQLKDEKKSIPLKFADLMDLTDEDELEVEKILLENNPLLTKKNGVIVLNEILIADYPQTVKQIDILIMHNFESLREKMLETQKALYDPKQVDKLEQLYLELVASKAIIDKSFAKLEVYKKHIQEALHFTSPTDPLRENVQEFSD